MTTSGGLSLVVFSGGYDRVHYALAMAAAASAIGRPVSLLFSGRALTALLAESAPGQPGWLGLDPADDGSSPAERDHVFAGRGIGTLDELLGACAALGVTVIVCEMAVRALGLPAGIRLRDDVPSTPGGIVSFLSAGVGHAIVFI